jgi:hypothetical protein
VHGMRLGMVRYPPGRGRHLAWEENGEIRGLMNRSHNQIAVAVQWFLGTRRRRAGRPRVLLAPVCNLNSSGDVMD